jgi:hypothetical protein
MSNRKTPKRRKYGLEFPEVQDYVNLTIAHWCVDNKTNQTGLANDILGIDKARLSEIKSTERNESGVEVFKHPLTEKLLHSLMWEGIVDLEEIAKRIDPKDRKKQRWIKHQRYLKIIEKIEDAKKDYPIEEKLNALYEEVKRPLQKQ